MKIELTQFTVMFYTSISKEAGIYSLLSHELEKTMPCYTMEIYHIPWKNGVKDCINFFFMLNRSFNVVNLRNAILISHVNISFFDRLLKCYIIFLQYFLVILNWILFQNYWKILKKLYFVIFSSSSNQSWINRIYYQNLPSLKDH